MSFQNQSRKMAQEQAYDQPLITQEDAPAVQIPTNDELVPTAEYIRIGECNHQFRISLFECDHPIIYEILKNIQLIPALIIRLYYPHDISSTNLASCCVPH